MYCSKCGTNVTDGAAFCSACGQPTAGPPTIAPTAARPAPGIPAPYVPPPLTPILPSPYAGFWLRVVAHLIDDLLLGIGIGILVLIGVAMVGVDSIRSMAESMKGDDFQMPGTMISAIIFVSVASIVMVWLYNAAMESSKHQGTLGKMALGLIVTDLQGRPIGFGHATGRYFAKIITGLIPFGIGYAMAGFTEKKQALHDMIAGCLVLRRT
ncbi:MAG: RDD family protein [Candidatus Acidiferrales bacterium]